MVSSILPLILAILAISRSQCAKILFTAAVDSGTHMGSMLPLIRRLAEVGHQVVAFETSSLTSPRQLGHPNISFVFIPSESSGHLPASVFLTTTRSHTIRHPYIFGNEKLGEYLLSESEKLTELLNTDWDLVILDELFGVHSYALAMHLKHTRATPYIIYSTTAMIQTTAHSLALARNWVSEPYLLTSIPNSDSDTYNVKDFADRLYNFQEVLTELLLIGFYAQRHDLTNIAKLGVGPFTWSEFFLHSSWIFADYLDRSRIALSESSDVIGIGAHCAKAKALPAELEKFVGQPNSSGTIYVAFGSNVEWGKMSAHVVAAFFQALEQLSDYRIVFTYNGDVKRVGNHIKLVKWAPQLDLLAHTTTKLFISHGGLKSFKEALCAQKPVIFVPIFAEQAYNTKLALRMGYASSVNKLSITAKTFLAAIRIVLNNYAYYQRAARVAHDFFVDRPIHSFDAAVFSVERILKTPSQRMPHFLRRGMEQTVTQALYVELGILLMMLIFLISL